MASSSCGTPAWTGAGPQPWALHSLELRGNWLVFSGACAVYIAGAELVLFLWPRGRGLGFPSCKVAFAFACFLFLLLRLSQRSQSPWAGWARCPILCAMGKATLEAGGKLLG